METWEKKLTGGLRVGAVGIISIIITTLYAVGVTNYTGNIILFAEIMGLFCLLYSIWTLKVADIEKRRSDEARRLLDLAKIKIGQVVYWRMDISTIVLVRIHTVSVSPDNTIEYSASSLHGDEISFTDEQIGKEIFVDLQEVPEQDLFECRKKGEKLLWIEIQNKEDTHGL